MHCTYYPQRKSHWATPLITLRPPQPAEPCCGFKLWRSKRINPVMLRRSTGISQHVCVRVRVKGVYGVCRCVGRQKEHIKIITLHSTQILHWATLAHIFHRHQLQHTHIWNIMPLSEAIRLNLMPLLYLYVYPSSVMTRSCWDLKKKSVWRDEIVLFNTIYKVVFTKYAMLHICLCYLSCFICLHTNKLDGKM